MKFRVDTIDLGERLGWTTEKGEAIYVKVPIGVTEGFIKQMSDLRGEDEEGNEIDPGGRQGNLMVLDLITEWNFDDESGKTLPLTRTIKPGTKANDKKRLEILASLPIELPGLLAREAVATSGLTEQAETFSKTSSESS